MNPDLIQNLRIIIAEMRDHGATPRVIEVNQRTLDTYRDGLEQLGLPIVVKPLAPDEMVYIRQTESEVESL